MEPRVHIIIALLESDPRSDFSIEELAKIVNLSPSRLRHVFKAETGQSPTHYRNTLRMQQARNLIETTFLSIKEIMLKAGIKNKSQFARDFKRAYGLTPVVYRARHFSNTAKTVAKSTIK
ncbi:MAG: transcriptional regulator, AraC family [Acidobacteria bacterium]|nr:transcriptional regulator, AraC family [Acidobacteriota bacterium]